MMFFFCSKYVWFYLDINNKNILKIKVNENENSIVGQNSPPFYHFRFHLSLFILERIQK